MRRLLCVAVFISIMSIDNNLTAHCQMPCGIYHDDMVFAQVNQFVETMHKGISVINQSKFVSISDRNEVIRWVMQKDKDSDKMAELILTYFLQQKIKPGEPDTVKKLVAAHHLLFLLVAIKQNADLQMVKDFSKEWDKFKAMFHLEAYECEMQKVRVNKWEKDKAKQENTNTADVHKTDSADNDDHYHGYPHSHHSHSDSHIQIRDIRVRENEEAGLLE
jgi:nickel superoxide dismutase